MKLDLSNRNLRSEDLAKVDLTGVTMLCVYANKLTFLPTLPPTLIELDCSNNTLISLPDLPSNLKVLNCAVNELTSLGTLPSNLKVLLCSYNKLTDIPDIPLTLEYFRYSKNPEYLSDHLTENITNIKLRQHNERRRKLGLETVDKLTIEEWDELNERYTTSRYEPGGDMFEQAQQQIGQLLSKTD